MTVKKRESTPALFKGVAWAVGLMFQVEQDGGAVDPVLDSRLSPTFCSLVLSAGNNGFLGNTVSGITVGLDGISGGANPVVSGCGKVASLSSRGPNDYRGSRNRVLGCVGVAVDILASPMVFGIVVPCASVVGRSAGLPPLFLRNPSV
jgi:hypothetical protein